MITIDVSPAVVDVVGVAFDALSLGLLVDLTTATGDVGVEAVAYTSITYGDPEVRPLPAQVYVEAVAPLSVDLGPEAPVVEVLPAAVNVQGPMNETLAEPIVGAVNEGDSNYPFVIRESGSDSYEDSGPGVYFMYQADAAMQITLTVSGSNNYNLEILDPVDGDIMASTSDTITYDVISGLTPFRVESDGDGTFTLTWSYTPVTYQLMMDILTPNLDRAPTDLRVSIQGGLPNEDIRFTWSPAISDLIPSVDTRPIILAEVGSDFEGNILVATLPIRPVYKGTYLLTAQGRTSGYLVTGSFNVLNDPLPQDSTGAQTEPVAQVGSAWLWDDANGHTWVMPKNPDRMTSVIKPKVLLREHTVSGQGQDIIWQGPTPAVDWSFQGTITTEQEYQELEYFYNLDRKFYITTHRNKTYIVTVRNFDPRPRRNGNNFWTFDYTVDCILFNEYVGESA
jgi:hypothetical protein